MDWLGSCESVVRTSGGCCTHRKAQTEEADGGSSGNTESVSRSLFLEVNILRTWLLEGYKWVNGRPMEIK